MVKLRTPSDAVSPLHAGHPAELSGAGSPLHAGHPAGLLLSAHRPAEGRRPLLVDLDDTMFWQKEPTTRFLNGKYGVDVSVEQVTSFYVQEAYLRLHGIEIGRPEVQAIHRMLWEEGPELIHPEIPAIMSRLGEVYSIRIVTQSVADMATIKGVLGQHAIGYDTLERVSSSSEKIERQPNAVACIDDHGGVIMDFAQAGRVGIVLDYPWNKGAVQNGHGKVVRVGDWLAAEQYLLSDEMLRAATAATRG